MLIKTCGITDEIFIQHLDEIDIQMIGFIFYPESKRFVDRKLDAKLVASKLYLNKSTGILVISVALNIVDITDAAAQLSNKPDGILVNPVPKKTREKPVTNAKLSKKLDGILVKLEQFSNILPQSSTPLSPVIADEGTSVRLEQP